MMVGCVVIGCFMTLQAELIVLNRQDKFAGVNIVAVIALNAPQVHLTLVERSPDIILILYLPVDVVVGRSGKFGYDMVINVFEVRIVIVE